MRANRHSLIWYFLICTAITFGQRQTKIVKDSFKVNKDVLVEINARYSDIKVETWKRNIVSIEGIWEVEGMNKEEAEEYFKHWNFEALGNKNKVVINSKSSNKPYHSHDAVFDDMDFDFDFDFDMESIAHIGEMFQGNFYSNLPPTLNIPPVPPMTSLPSFPAQVVDHLKDLNFDYEAYLEDKESYMKEFEKHQKSWEKEFEDKFAPQMEAYEKEMKKWEKKIEPQMKAYEEKMKQWEKEYGPKMKEYEKKMEKKLKEMEKEMEYKYAEKMKEKKTKMSKYKIRKNLLIKVPVGATLKVDTRYGKIILPDNMKTTN